jgi:hypothetical protein
VPLNVILHFFRYMITVYPYAIRMSELVDSFSLPYRDQLAGSFKGIVVKFLFLYRVGCKRLLLKGLAREALRRTQLDKFQRQCYTPRLSLEL